MQKSISTLGLLSFFFLSLFLLVSFTDIEEKIAHILPQVVKSVYAEQEYSFAGEKLPNTFDAKERLDRELSVNAYWHSTTVLNLKSANRYFPVIEPILREMGVPEDFKYLAVAESNLRNVTSPANAKGIWQFRKLAAKEMGLEVNDEVDERYHAAKATRAAAKYLKKLHKRFGTWADAAAAYNVGPTNYSKILKNQNQDSYFDLNLNQETARYVFRLMAIKEVMQDPIRYGFQLENHELYPPLDDFYNVELETGVTNWGKFATDHGITYRQLKIYNPWLRDNKITVKNNKYLIKVPRKK